MSSESKIAYCKTPIGTAKLVGDADGLQSVTITDEDYATVPHTIPDVLATAVTQLNAYFNKDLIQFDLKLNLIGTDFQKKVWTLLQEIPFGKALSYSDLSIRYGDIKAIRAIAHANAVNPFWIIVPCHRIIGKDGSLTGYAGALWRKKWLLEHEGILTQMSLF